MAENVVSLHPQASSIDGQPPVHSIGTILALVWRCDREDGDRYLTAPMMSDWIIKGLDSGLSIPEPLHVLDGPDCRYVLEEAELVSAPADGCVLDLPSPLEIVSPDDHDNQSVETPQTLPRFLLTAQGAHRVMKEFGYEDRYPDIVRWARTLMLFAPRELEMC